MELISSDDTQPILPARPGCWRYLPLVLAMLAAIIALFVVVAWVLLLMFPGLTEKSVTVIIDGSAFSQTTRAATVENLFNELNIALNEGDLVIPALQSGLTQGLVVSVNRARSVSLTIDGQSRIYRTHLTNPAEILSSAGLNAGADDLIIVDGTEIDYAALARWPVPASQIQVKRAVQLTIDDNGSRRSIKTTSRTVGDALFDAGITLYLADVVVPELNVPLVPDSLVTIRRSRPVSIIADGVTIETRSQGKTVADALTQAGIALLGLDYAIPDETAALLPGMRIRVIRVTEEVVIERITKPPETIYQADPTLEIDQRAERQAGQEGIIENRVRVRYENGVEISRELEESLTFQEPSSRVITYGTNIVLRTVDTPDGPRQYWRRLRMYATSYHPAALGGDNITATGRVLTKGIVSSDPNVIPYGSQIYVPGYGVGLMADTGGPRRRLWIDLGYDDDNFQSWSRWVDVYLLTPVPDQIDYLLP